MEPIRTFVREHFSSSCAETIKRREDFENFLFNILPTENDISASYLFTKVRGDGNCFFHAILRYWGYINWMDLPNKDQKELAQDEIVLYNTILSNLRLNFQDFAREFMGDPSYVLDKDCPEYLLGCRFLSNLCSMRIITLEYDAFQSKSLNRVCV